MERDSSTAKKFTEYVDKILAGAEVSASEELSDELRSALDFARTVLANRDEPSPAFRTQLREKLLRKLVEQEAAARSVVPPRGLRELISSIFTQQPAWRIVTSAALIVLLLIVGTVWYTREYSPASVLVSLPPLPAGEYSVNLPSNIIPASVTVEVKTSLSSQPGQAAVYRIAEPQVTPDSVVALGRKLGFSGSAVPADGGEMITMTEGTGSTARKLTVWTVSGAVDYGFVEPGKLYPVTSPNLPSEKEAKRIAYDFLGKAGLLPVGYKGFSSVQEQITVLAGGSYSIAARGAGKTTQKAPTFWLVSLPYSIDGTRVTGPGAKIEVSVGDGGEVVRIVQTWRQLSPAFNGQIRSEEAAYKDLVSGRGSLDVPLASDILIVKGVTLAYWIDPASERQEYALPVYEFKGECLDRAGNHLEDFTAWTEALLKTY